MAIACLRDLTLCFPLFMCRISVLTSLLAFFEYLVRNASFSSAEHHTSHAVRGLNAKSVRGGQQPVGGRGDSSLVHELVSDAHAFTGEPLLKASHESPAM